jgi:type I restriction enzyme S subunit
MSFTESLDTIVEENRNQLVGKHASWERVQLSDIASILNGFPFESHRFTANPEKGSPLIRIRDVLRSVTDTYYEGEFDPAYLIQSGDLLVGMDGDFNSAVWHGNSGLLNQRVCKIALQSVYFDRRFLAYCLPGYLSAINAHTSSITVKHLSSRTIADIPLPLPPLREQSCIADALDELFSDLDAGVAALTRAREKLKLYRAAVLKAAVEGALTADWCTQHPNTEPASELLKRILAERRRRWEEDQLAKFKAKSQEPPKNWQAKYKEPMEPDASNLQSLPEGWWWVTLDQLLWRLRTGTAETSSRAQTDYPVLKSSAVRHGAIDFQDVNYLQGSQSVSSESFLQRGDFLITRLSGSVNYVGCTAVVGDVECEGIQYPDRIFCGKLVRGVNGRYLTYCFQYPDTRKSLEAAAKSTAGHQRISISDLLPLRFPLPPLAEQEAIVEAVEDQLSVIEHLEADIEAKLKSAQALRQAILRDAFIGRLVPQDSNDEPASELLKRIAAEREARAREAQAAKPGKRNGERPRAGRRKRPRQQPREVA